MVGGATAEQEAETRAAHFNAITHAALAEGELREHKADALYGTWFGAEDEARYDTVTRHYGEIGTVLVNEQVTYDFSGEECEPGIFAFTFDGSRTVWLCELYFPAEETGSDTKFGVLIHEWSHAISETDDFAGGEAACQELAENNPGQAVENGDNHEYFAENL